MSERVCALCGKDPAAGHASMWTAAEGETWYCHGDDDETPTCYERANMGPVDREPLMRYLTLAFDWPDS